MKLDHDQWDWARDHTDPRIRLIWTIGNIAEIDNIVKFQKGKWDCSDAGMILYWITGANMNDGLKAGSMTVVKTFLEDYVENNPEPPFKKKR